MRLDPAADTGEPRPDRLVRAAGAVVERTGWLGERRADPLSGGLGPLAAASAVALVLLAGVGAGSLELRVLTGHPVAPSLAMPWWTGWPVVLLAVVVGLVVVAESAVRRRERPGQVMRLESGVR